VAVVTAMVSAVAVVLLVAFIVGGEVYRTECQQPNGLHTQGWEFGENIPYLTVAHPGCTIHSLTRYVLGKIGVMSDVET
jgi:hypothetical protein